MTAVLFTGGRVVDPSQSLDKAADVLIVDGVIEEVGGRVDVPADSDIGRRLT